MSRASTQQALRQLPTRWALGLLGLIVLYAVLQPVANDRLGWKLPSLSRLLGEPEPKQQQPKTRAESKSKADAQSKADADLASESNRVDGATREPARVPDDASQSKKKSETASNKKAEATAKPAANERPDSQRNSESSSLLYGLLRDTGGKRYVSPAGLQYNPGSEEGHRLKHIERHLQDDPDRPGKHGVFDGDMQQVIRWIDDAYTRGTRGGKGVRKSEEDGRTVYEVPFDQPIGMIGGRDGNRANHPPAKRMRLVLDGVKVITAFPF